MFGDTPSNRKRLLRSLKNGEVKGKKFGKRWFVYTNEVNGGEEWKEQYQQLEEPMNK